MKLNQLATDYDKLAEEALETLDRWDQRFKNHCSSKREFQREGFRAKLKARIPYSTDSKGQPAATGEFYVWARNLSQSGVSFIHHKELPLVSLLLCLDSETKGELWYMVKIVRKRQIYNDFWEYGASLEERISF